MKKIIFIFILQLYFNCLTAETVAPWVSYPSANQTEYGVYHFRKTIELDKVPAKFVIHVSADNRYNLLVNGTRVCNGPAKGDLKTYKYDVIDIASHLKAGKNVLAALVYNGGTDRPLSFVVARTAFMLRAEDSLQNFINTNVSWKVKKNEAYQVISYYEMLWKKPWMWGFYACGGGDEVNAKDYPWKWETLDFDDSAWKNAETLIFEDKAPWNLVARNIPFMDNHQVLPQSIRRVEGANLPVAKWNGQQTLTIPGHSKATILVDFETFTMGYPDLTVRGGDESTIKINYAEGLYDTLNLKAYHRDTIAGRKMEGVFDIFHPYGREAQVFRPLWQRTFRYVQFQIETKDQALDIISYTNEYAGYPYPDMSTFVSNDQKLNQVFDICLRTFRLCSAETYYDTPYYEQLNYGGDNLPISGISVYNSTDDQLLREAMRMYAQSENKTTGLMKSAYPSRFDFDHGTWGLAWIQSLHDYYFMRGDSAYVAQFTGSFDRTLDYFKRAIDKKTGLIGTVKTNCFMDWSITKGRVPRENANKETVQSVLLTLFYAHTLDCTVRLYEKIGLPAKAAEYAKISQGLKNAVYISSWNEEKQLFRDYPDQEIYSQHTNIMAILCDVVTPTQQVELLKRIISYKQFDEMASSYFSYYLFRAMEKTEQEDLFLENLGFWYTFLDRGFTTCGESGFASHDRSDCHAWSAHPATFLMSMVCGIKPADIGFNTVLIAPHLGTLKSIKASMPHPKGKISVDYKRTNSTLIAEIILPGDLTGTFKYNNTSIPLKSGINRLKIQDPRK